ncbi:MAG TPA: hypothetical protein VJ453_00115 [Terriglobales bacterium]|nr:hypothetical protein [Terriglobales bacterium]
MFTKRPGEQLEYTGQMGKPPGDVCWLAHLDTTAGQQQLFAREIAGVPPAQPEPGQ